MTDFCCECGNTIDSCPCNDFDAEIQRLVKKNNRLMLESTECRQENKQLKEALKKCSPFSRRGLCEFCVLGNWEHTDDCEYVRLTGGAE